MTKSNEDASVAVETRNEARTEIKSVKIDYMHPDGTVEGTTESGPEQEKANQAEQRKPISKQALQEADGHHMCSASCLGHKTRRQS